MQELQDIKTAVRPQEILLVVDAMTGQDAVTVAESFDGQLGVDGIILTKLDGDARGGAALSVRSVTNKPIKYIGMGEKMEDLEPFYPDRMASRILGMGDVLSLIDKVQANIDEQEALDMAKKMRANDFTLEDFLAQMQQIKKMGPLKDLLGMMPGIPGMGKLDLDAALNGVDPQKEMARTEAIIQSMTKEERANPSILNGPRKKRIAAGCGRSIADVNRLIKQFEEMKKEIILLYATATSQLNILKLNAEALMLANVQYSIAEKDFSNGAIDSGTLSSEKSRQSDAQEKFENSKSFSFSTHA
jgi:signal recognition particle subunit SRP54